MTLAIIFESVGAGEWLVLLAVVLIVVGPKKLPATARKFGQHYAKFRRAAESFKRQLLEMDTEISNAVNEAEREVEAAAKDADPDLAPPDPSEYGGIDYADYGGYDPAGPADTPSEPEQPVESVKAEAPKKPDPTGIKITVSPVPKPEDASKAGA